MSSNAWGTVFRIFGITILLLSFWLIIVGLFYLAVFTIIGVEVKISSFLLVFLCFLLFRMFYPKNVFI